MGGIAALIGAATNLLGLVVFAALLLPKGLGSEDADPGKTVALLADNQGAMRIQRNHLPGLRRGPDLPVTGAI